MTRFGKLYTLVKSSERDTYSSILKSSYFYNWLKFDVMVNGKDKVYWSYSLKSKPDLTIVAETKRILVGLTQTLIHTHFSLNSWTSCLKAHIGRLLTKQIYLHIRFRWARYGRVIRNQVSVPFSKRILLYGRPNKKKCTNKTTKKYTQKNNNKNEIMQNNIAKFFLVHT